MVGWCTLSAAAVVLGSRTVESDLAERVETVLARRGVDAEIVIDGRDVVLRSADPVPDALVAELRGATGADFDLRSVEVELAPDATSAAVTIPPPATTRPPATVPAPPATTVPPSTTVPPPSTTRPAAPETTSPQAAPATVEVVATLDPAGRIVLRGRVFSVVEQAALVLTAERIVGPDGVVDELEITEGDTLTGDTHVAGLVRIVELFGTELAPVEAVLAAGTVTVVGTDRSAAGSTRLADAVALGQQQGVVFDLRLSPAEAG